MSREYPFGPDQGEERHHLIISVIFFFFRDVSERIEGLQEGEREY